MKTRGILWISAGILIFALFTAWIRLPLVSSSIWMSPDETANMISAITFANEGVFSFSSEITSKFIWAHPRSFVYVPETNMVAPIGFLGMPLILSFIYKLFGLIGLNFFVPFLALLTLFPLWKSLPKKWPQAVKLMTIIIWMSFPSIILYINRGAFPQTTQLCLMIWVWFLITNSKASTTTTKYYDLFVRFSLPIAGALSGLALMIRPIEAIWILPVIILAFLSKPTNQAPHSTFDVGRATSDVRRLTHFLIPLIFVLLVGAKLGADTYGKWFTSGYQIRPEVIQLATGDSSKVSAESDAVSIFSALPFSFHPRNIWWNLKNYVIWFFLPWLSLVFGSALILYKEKFWRDKSGWSILALAWTPAILVLFYGNGIYQDHVRLNEISIGNSFIRYILPISITFAVSAGFIFSRLWRHWTLKLFAVCITIGLTSFGLFTATIRDDEGISKVEQELISYQKTREAGSKNFPANGIIVSDRSDKIFFPVHLAVSPMPTTSQLQELFAQGVVMRFYLPTQDEDGLNKWSEQGFTLRPIFTTGNQTLYDTD
ncbi:MAG: hypothetical protein P1P90_02425 [Patescibacteria group bacterium]|nr:hypothetical protein [Patescibacteria group bacterium]